LAQNKDFLDFKKYFREYQKRFGLTGYHIYFKFEPIDDCFATISIKQGDLVATVILNSKLLKGEKQFKHIKLSAKHEALHLLVARLEHNGLWRHSSEQEIHESTEELVVKLLGLIGG